IDACPRDDRAQGADDADHGEAECREQQHGVDVIALRLQTRPEPGDEHRRGQNQHAQQAGPAYGDELGENTGQEGTLGGGVIGLAQRTYPSFLSTVWANSSPTRYSSNSRWNC